SVADQESETKPGASFVFLPGTIQASEYGTKVHELFESTPWIDALGPNELEDTLASNIDEADEVEISAMQEVLKNLNTDPVSSIFRKSSFPLNPIAWLEKRFELIDEGKWISGTFDRVVVQQDEKQRATTADVYDFKTNKVSSQEEVDEACAHYAPQLAIYRLALSRLLGIPEQEVRSHLVFTRLAKVVEVEQPF
ncbi:MAG: PD-(D/E)XK nuclease family protein, partial [Verrucomicrobiota bacterium]